ncbi:MAG: SLC13 family permease [Gemmatimonadota bacterium]
MSYEAGLTLGVLGLAIFAITLEILSPDLVLFAALVVLLAAGVIDVDGALAGFSNPAVATVGALFVVAAGLRATGALEALADRVLGRRKGMRRPIGRMTATTAAASAFINNTPIVAMGVPVVTSWARRHGVSPSKLLIPLSYASIVGGTCTLIGTSTNLVGDGLLRTHGLAGLGFFELAIVGVPSTLLALVYLVFVSPAVLEDRIPIRAEGKDVRRYLAEMRLSAPSPLIGRSIEEAGLRHLPGLFLVRIERSTGVLSPVSPTERLREGDRLTFAGVVETILDLRRFRGLEPPTSPPEDADAEWMLHEAVVSPGSPLVGTSIRRANFRARYNAVVIAVHRHGERIESRIGDIVLRPGDTLLIEAAPGFTRAYRNSTDFYLVSEVEESEGPKRGHMLRAVAVLAAIVVLATIGAVPIVTLALGGGILMVGMRCLSPGDAKRSVDWPVLIIIGSALGLAGALETSGAAHLIAGAFVAAGSAFGTTGVLAALILCTMLLTAFLTNTAAAALMIPIAIAAAAPLGLDARPLVIALTVSASLSFASPLGYQTNLMVYGPGGYRFTDFLKLGLPLQLALGAVVVAVVQAVWM